MRTAFYLFLVPCPVCPIPEIRLFIRHLDSELNDPYDRDSSRHSTKTLFFDSWEQDCFPKQNFLRHSSPPRQTPPLMSMSPGRSPFYFSPVESPSPATELRVHINFLLRVIIISLILRKYDRPCVSQRAFKEGSP